jgi:iron-sulfur cluster assembly protein
MFRVTQAAATQVKVAAQQGGTDGMPLRLGAQQKPDGSIDYLMGFDEASDEDIRSTSEGVEIVMAPEYVPLLDEALMDYVELEQGEHQFIFINPRDANYSPPADSTDSHVDP